MNRRADVVIPVYRNVELTRRCIRAVLKSSGPALGQLIVVNDCSPEPKMAPMLAGLQAEVPDMVLFANETNQGFVGSTNRGLNLRQRDVVVLNSDALVTPGWLDEMLEVAYLS